MAGAGVVSMAAAAAGVLNGGSALEDAQSNTLKRPNGAGARLRGGRGGYPERPRGLGGPLGGGEAHC